MVIVKKNEMQLRPQAIKAEYRCSQCVEMNEDEITSSIVMKVSYNHLGLAGLLVAGVGCCYSVLYLQILTLYEIMP